MIERSCPSDSALTAEQARELTDRIKIAVEGTWQLVKQAYETRAWAALGYLSWDDYCTREFGTSRLRLPREERQEVVASLRESGLSLRAIESVTGVTRKTVIKDLRQVVESPPPGGGEIVTGTDGKSYPAANGTKSPPTGKTRADVREREEMIRELAESGHTAGQIAQRMNLSEGGTKDICRRIGVATADDVIGKRRRVNSERVLQETITSLEGLAIGVGLIDLDTLDPLRLEQWATSLSGPLQPLNRLAKQLKEMTRGQQ